MNTNLEIMGILTLYDLLFACKFVFEYSVIQSIRFLAEYVFTFSMYVTQVVLEGLYKPKN